jgi:hypothetical protein
MKACSLLLVLMCLWATSSYAKCLPTHADMTDAFTFENLTNIESCSGTELEMLEVHLHDAVNQTVQFTTKNPKALAARVQLANFKATLALVKIEAEKRSK